MPIEFSQDVSRMDELKIQAMDWLTARSNNPGKA